MDRETTLEDRRGRLDSGRRSLLAKRVASAKGEALSGGVSRLPALVADAESWGRPFALTPAQRQAKGGYFYHEIEAPALDLGRAESSWRALVREHGMLRLTTSGSEQRISPERTAPCIVVLDLSELPAPTVQARLDALRDDFSWKTGPAAAEDQAFRICAARLPGGSTRLYLRLEQVALDGPSAHLLLLEWRRLYLDQVSPARRGISFRDYANCHEVFREADVYGRAREFWLDQAAHEPDVPSPFRLDNVLSTPFRRRSQTLPTQAWQLLQKRATERGVSPSAVVLAVFTQVLGQGLSLDRLALDVLVFNRLGAHPEVSNLIGPFASNTRVYADDLRAPGLLERAVTVQKQLWQGLENWYCDAGSATGHALPILFTSALAAFTEGGVAQAHAAATADNPLSWLGESVHCVAVRPGVCFEHQALENGSSLLLVWDVADGIIPDSVLDSMWARYLSLLGKLCNG